MLYVQESFAHSSSLLMSPPMTISQPQPLSPSLKMVDQLTSKYESVQRELAATQIQIESARQVKLQYEKEASNYTNNNKAIRNHIQETMQILESKQKILERTKGSSLALENKVKQLKNQAMTSRAQLEDLRKREQVIQHDRDSALKEKKHLEHQQFLLRDSVKQLRARCDREAALLKKDYGLLVEQINYIKEKSECTMELIEIKLLKRRQTMEHLANTKEQFKLNTEGFVHQVRVQLQALKTEIERSALLPSKDCTTTTTTTTVDAALQCHQD
ncbi:hypothetical protein CU098_004066, partial [Rhizopus stolonifer]